MMALICSSAELRKHVGAVILSGVDRYIGIVGLNLPEEQEVLLATNCSESLEDDGIGGSVTLMASRA